MSKPTPLSAINDQGKPVDWWFIYKVAGDSTASDGSKPKGTEYVYYDSSFTAGAKKLVFSADLIGDATDGAVGNTLNQIYHGGGNAEMGWFFYNDEDPLTGITNGVRGHTKGVLCFDLATQSGFWLIDSAPKFPPKGTYSYPPNAKQNAQTFLCITLKDADTAKAIAAQMLQAQQPNVFLASAVPPSLPATDPRVLLIQNKVPAVEASYANFITFQSKGGQSFRSIAKNKEWNKANDDDFYNDLVGPALAESLEVETWEHGLTPGQWQPDKVHTVIAMKSVNLAPLGIKPSYEWSEVNDHAKLAISDQNEKVKYVCVGDINFTVAQEKRSGGTVAFICPPLWGSIIEILSAVNIKVTRGAAAGTVSGARGTAGAGAAPGAAAAAKMVNGAVYGKAL